MERRGFILEIRSVRPVIVPWDNLLLIHQTEPNYLRNANRETPA